MPHELKLTAEQVSLILKRAAELDARGPSVTADELIAIASEAGLDPAATAAAIQEITTSKPVPVVQPVKPASSVPSIKNTAGRAFLGGVLGLFAAAAGGATIALPAFGAATIFTLFSWMRGRFKDSKLSLFFDNFTTWLGFFVGAGAANSHESPDMMILAAMLWVVTSLVGLSLPRGTPKPELPPADSR